VIDGRVGPVKHSPEGVVPRHSTISPGFRVRTPAGDIPARLQIASFYDRRRRQRILDR
jgi:hypothetical protein